MVVTLLHWHMFQTNSREVEAPFVANRGWLPSWFQTNSREVEAHIDSLKPPDLPTVSDELS